MKVRTGYRCADCGTAASGWLGRCPFCQAWGTVVEDARPARSASSSACEPLALDAVDVDAAHVISTGVGELDRVLGGGVLPGSVTLLGGEPGIGKSTLLLQVLAALGARGVRSLLVAGEESPAQVRRRAERLGAVHPGMHVVDDTALREVFAHVEALRPDVVAVDSIQTLVDPELPGGPGSVGQVRGCAQQLVRRAKQLGVAVVVVGHVTKNGTLAGPRSLEHVVDTVLAFEGDRHHALRFLRALKHRFGSTQELGVLEMAAHGLVDVPDPSSLFLADRPASAAGSVVVPVMHGTRPLLVEVQALVGAPVDGTPRARRVAQGIDPARLAMLLAVLGERCDVAVGGSDVYASVAGGVRVADPGADLAIALAIASARSGRPVGDDVVAIGEVGLGGELRQVAHIERRLVESSRLRFEAAIVPASLPADVVSPGSLRVVRAGTLSEAIAAAFRARSRREQRAPACLNAVAGPPIALVS